MKFNAYLITLRTHLDLSLKPGSVGVFSLAAVMEAADRCISCKVSQSNIVSCQIATFITAHNHVLAAVEGGLYKTGYKHKQALCAII